MSKFIRPVNYVKFINNKILIITQPVISIFESYLSYNKRITTCQPVFIIGAPRTGSTVLYQAITNQLDTLYIDNLVCKFYRNLFFGVWLSHKIFNNNAHDCSRSTHGNTSSCGLRAPSECGGFWYRWLTTEKHFIDSTDVSNEVIEKIRKEILTPIRYFDKPMVFKNLNNGQRLRLLAKCFPDAKFIFVRRDPIFTAQSIIRAKRALNINDNEFWSVMPKNVEELKKLDGISQVIQQIYYIEKQIEEDRHLFPNDAFLDIHYSEMKDLNMVMERVKKHVTTKERKSFNKMIIKVKEVEKLPKEEFSRLKIDASKFDWNKYEIK